MVRIAGVYPPIATPFDGRGHLDEVALAENIVRWNPTGLSGYVVAGSNGESAYLEPDEVARAVRIVRSAALPEQTVIAGTGRESTAGTIALTLAAAEAGADVALVVTPFFYGGEMTPAALTRHFIAVADASPVPVLIYNVPKFTHLNIDAATVASLAAHDNIVGVKDSSGNIAQMVDLMRLCPAGFDVMVGNGPAYLSSLQIGAAGGILALANVAPRECVAIRQAVLSGDLARAREIHFRMMPVGRAVTSGYGVPGLKACLDLLGYHGGAPRPPLLPADAQTRASCEAILREAGLL